MSLIQLGTWAQLWILGLTAHSGGGLTLRTAEGVFRAQILPNAAWRIVGQRSGVSWEDQRSQFHVGQTPYGPGYSVQGTLSQGSFWPIWVRTFDGFNGRGYLDRSFETPPTVLRASDWKADGRDGPLASSRKACPILAGRVFKAKPDAVLPLGDGKGNCRSTELKSQRVAIQLGPVPDCASPTAAGTLSSVKSTQNAA